MAKAPDFSSKIKENAPEVSYTTPKAMPAKYDSTTGAANTATDLIKGAIELDKEIVNQEIEEQVEPIRRKVENQNLNAYNSNLQALEEERLGLKTTIDIEGTTEPYEEEMDQLTNKIIQAKEQGVFTAVEANSRINAIGDQFLNDNPEKADQITTKIASILKRGSYSSILDNELDILKEERKQKQKEFNDVTKFLDDQRIIWRGKEYDEVMSMYFTEKQELRQDMEYEKFMQSGIRAEEAQKLEFFNELGGTPGLYKQTRRNYNLLYNQLEFIEDQEKNIDAANDARQRLIQAFKDKIRFTVNMLPARNESERKRNSDYFTAEIASINKLDEEMQKVVPGNRKEFFTMKRDEMLLEQELIQLQSGYNPAEAKRAKLQLESLNLLVTGGNGKLLELVLEQKPGTIKEISDALKESILNQGKKINYQSENGQYYNEKIKANNYGSYLSFSNLINAEIESKALTPYTLSYFNNLFSTSNSLSGDNKMKELDLLIPVIGTKTSATTLQTLMTQPDFSNDLLSNLEFYREAALSRIPDNVEVIESNGLLYSPMNTRLNNNLISVNNYIIMKSKMENKKPSDILDLLLGDDLSQLNVKGKIITMPSGQQGTKEELFGSEDSIDFSNME